MCLSYNQFSDAPWISSTAAVWGHPRINSYPVWNPLLPHSSSPLKDSSPDILLLTAIRQWTERSEIRRTQDFPCHRSTLHTPHIPSHSSCLPANMAWSSYSQRMRMINYTSKSFLQRETIHIHSTTGKHLISCPSKYSVQHGKVHWTAGSLNHQREWKEESPSSSGWDASGFETAPIISKMLLRIYSELPKIQWCKETSRKHS